MSYDTISPEIFDKSFILFIAESYPVGDLTNIPYANDFWIQNRQFSALQFYLNRDKQMHFLYHDHSICEHENGERCKVGKGLLLIQDAIYEIFSDEGISLPIEDDQVTAIINTLVYMIHLLVLEKYENSKNSDDFVDIGFIFSFADFTIMEYIEILKEQSENPFETDLYYKFQKMRSKIEKHEKFGITDIFQ